jgi:hypothetical protein
MDAEARKELTSIKLRKKAQRRRSCSLPTQQVNMITTGESLTFVGMCHETLFILVMVGLCSVVVLNSYVNILSS